MVQNFDKAIDSFSSYFTLLTFENDWCLVNKASARESKLSVGDILYALNTNSDACVAYPEVADTAKHLPLTLGRSRTLPKSKMT